MKLKTCPTNYNIDKCSSSEYNLDCTTCHHVDNIKNEVETILWKYMDGENFTDGYIPDLYEVAPLRDDIVKLIQKTIYER